VEILIVAALIWWVLHIIGKKADKMNTADSQQEESHLQQTHYQQPQRRQSNELQIRIIDKTIPGRRAASAKIIEMRGMFPIIKHTNLGVVTSLLDVTDSTDRSPLFSFIDDLQEENSHAYQHKGEIGNMAVGYGTREWVHVALIIPDMLQPPYGGTRRLEVRVRLIDLDNPPIIKLGFLVDDRGGILWSRALQFEHTFSIKGYIESAENRHKAQALSIQIAMAVAMSDGELHESEGKVIHDWVVKAISSFEGDRKEELKKIYNEAMKTAYSNPQPLFELTEQLNEIGEKKTKYDAIELSYDVMRADGKMASGELNILRKISESLDIDPKILEEIEGEKLVRVDVSQLEDYCDKFLGIDSSWDKERIKNHLNSKFREWNNRQGAQGMLDLIAQCRRKHGL